MYDIIYNLIKYDIDKEIELLYNTIIENKSLVIGIEIWNSTGKYYDTIKYSYPYFKTSKNFTNFKIYIISYSSFAEPLKKLLNQIILFQNFI